MERQADVEDKKTKLLTPMIDLAELEFKIDIRKTPRLISYHFRPKEQTTIGFTCYLFEIDSQVCYRKIKRKAIKQNTDEVVVFCFGI